MKLQQYSIIQISARAILNHARRKEGSYYFYYDADSDTNRYAVQKTPQDDCAMYRQLFDLLGGHEFRGRDHLERSLEEALVYLDFSGIFDRRAVGRTKELQDMAEYLFRPEGIELNLGHGPLRFRAFERSASMSRENKLSFIRADLYDAMWERMTLGMKIGKCQLSKLYAYNGLMFTSGWAFDPETFTSYAKRIIVVDNPRSIVKNVSVVTVEDDGGTEPVRRYSRVEKTADIGVLEFDGEGLISLELKRELGPFGSDHYSFQIRLPYIKGVVHTVDLRALFADLGIEEIVDIEGVRHRALDVDMILTKSMCKGWGWMQENGLSWSEYMDRCVEYGHTLYISNTDRRSRDGLTELNFQLLNTAAITAAEYRPPELPFEWDSSPEKAEQTWLTKATETAYYNTISNESWQLSHFDAYRSSEELRFNDERKLRAELLHKNPAFLQEQVFQKELEEKGKQLVHKFGLGKLMINGDTRYLSDDLMRLLAVVVRPTSEQAYAALMRECLKGAEIYAPQPTFPMLEQLTVLRNPHISRNEEALVTPAAVGPLREKYLSQLYYVAMVDSRSLIPDRLGGADYDGDTVHLYAEPMLSACIQRNYVGGLENADNLPLLKIPSAEPLIADADDWRARFQTVKSTFSSRIGQISNAALRRSILAYDDSTPGELREKYRKETEVLTILTGLEIDSAKSGIKPELSEYLGDRRSVRSLFLRYKAIAGEDDEHEWYEPTKAKRLKDFFSKVDWDSVSANLERTPYYARQLEAETRFPKPRPAESAELFTFAADPDWREKVNPQLAERMRSIIADYEEAKRRCVAYRHMSPSGNYRRDIQRILFSRDQENEVSVDDLYFQFENIMPDNIQKTLGNLRESDWQFTPEEDRLLMLYALFPGMPPGYREVLCDFRCGGYRVLGDILMDLDAQYQEDEIKKHMGIRKGDSEQMKRMMSGALEAPDYRDCLIGNCKSIMQPSFRQDGDIVIPFDYAVMCAELLGKRSFILEVLPGTAEYLAVDRTKPKKKKAWWKLW